MNGEEGCVWGCMGIIAVILACGLVVGIGYLLHVGWNLYHPG